MRGSRKRHSPRKTTCLLRAVSRRPWVRLCVEDVSRVRAAPGRGARGSAARGRVIHEAAGLPA